jgi:NTE family protein
MSDTGTTAAAREEVPLRVGVALSAGSAASMAQIGVLEVLAEAGISLHSVAGTSAGAMVGAAHAAGRLAEFRAAMESLTRRRVLRLLDLAWPSEGLLHGLRALEFVQPHLGEVIEQLAIPYAAVATDLRSGDEVMLTSGSVFDAVRASIAIPGIFKPWRVGGRLLVDGGLVNPVPVSTARALGAEFVIAVNVLPLRNGNGASNAMRDHLQQIHSEGEEESDASTLERGQEIDDELGLVEIVWHASRILAAQIASARLRDDPPGFLLQIPVPDVGVFEFHRTAELVALGRRATESALPGLRAALARAIPVRRRLRRWQQRAASLFSLS